MQGLKDLESGMENRDIVVIGASAGGIEAVETLLSGFNSTLQAAIFVVIHIPAESPSMLAKIFNRVGPLNVKPAEDGEAIQQGQVYVAPPGNHMLVEPGYVRLHKGPIENRHRPAVDPLFRSAAVAYRSRVIGVVLTGFLDDGASGLLAVKRCGGLAIAQDPADAKYPDMPTAAVAAVEVDHQLPIYKMASEINRFVQESAPTADDVPADIAMEARISGRTMSDIRKEQKIGHLVPMSCPECSGPLWQMDTGSVRRYRCHVGHGFTAKALMATQDSALEQALWAAMRTMEERANLAKTMARDEMEKGRYKSAEVYKERAQNSKSHAQTIRDLLTA